mmetsp:Transcript_17900/g.55594  ORF Transcript_17900/g.55594 Transcript_17900/m.55594 type:complete len:257 (+) Transcript_17900:340-1110(+)
MRLGEAAGGAAGAAGVVVVAVRRVSLLLLLLVPLPTAGVSVGVGGGLRDEFGEADAVTNELEEERRRLEHRVLVVGKKREPRRGALGTLLAQRGHLVIHGERHDGDLAARKLAVQPRDDHVVQQAELRREAVRGRRDEERENGPAVGAALRPARAEGLELFRDTDRGGLLERLAVRRSLRLAARGLRFVLLHGTLVRRERHGGGGARAAHAAVARGGDGRDRGFRLLAPHARDVDQSADLRLHRLVDERVVEHDLA